MAYATQQNAVDLYGEDYVLTSVDRDADGNPDATSLTKALAQASSHIDSYLGTRYDVPLTPVPELVEKFCVDIAIYNCCPAATRTDEKRERYDDAIAWLKDVAKGVASVGVDAIDEVTEHSVEMASTNEARLFSRTKMGNL